MKSWGMRSVAGLALAVLGLAGVGVSSSASSIDEARLATLPLPVEVADHDFRNLRDSGDPGLQQRLRRAVRAKAAWRKLADRERLGVALVDISDIANPRFASVNGDTMMYAASLPKVAILVAAYQAIEDGTLADTPEVRADLGAMIRVSSNEAATRSIDRVGFDGIERVLTDPRYAFYDLQHGGGLWVGKRYAKTGPRIGDPLRNISHAATANQVARLYYMLATGRVINPERSRQILADLVDPGLHHKFVSVLERRAPDARLFRKSGTWRVWHSDSVMVWGSEWRHYILVGMVESADGERIMRDLVPVVEDVLRPPVRLAGMAGGK